MCGFRCAALLLVRASGTSPACRQRTHGTTQSRARAVHRKPKFGR
ncbi:TPA: hypothetical protein ACUNF5_007539 [Burkholderia orbicola]